jgi:hypothetical protein
MLKRKEGIGIIPFGKRPAWNLFSVYQDLPRAKQATAEMKAVADKFLAEHKRVAKKFEKEGIADTASRDEIMQYITKRMY